MSFPTVKGAVAISLADFTAANQVLDIKTTKVVGEIARDHRIWMSRALIGRLKPSHFAVLSAISSRTFGWGKILERIPLRHLREGIRDEDGNPKIDHYGFPMFEGTGLDVVTIRKALAELQSRRLIERFALQGERSEVSVYMPLSCRMLLMALTNSHRKREALVDLPDFFEANMTDTATDEETEWCSRYVAAFREQEAA